MIKILLFLFAGFTYGAEFNGKCPVCEELKRASSLNYTGTLCHQKPYPCEKEGFYFSCDAWPYICFDQYTCTWGHISNVAGGEIIDPKGKLLYRKEEILK